MNKFKLNRKHKILLISAAALIILLFLVFVFAKGWLLDKAVARMQEKLKRKYNVELAFKDYELDGWSQLNMKGISCLDEDKDTLLYFEDVSVDVKLLPVLSGKLRLGEMNAASGNIDLIRIKELKTVKADDVQSEKTDTTRFDKVKKYLHYARELAAMMPDNFLVKDVRVSYTDSNDVIRAWIDSMYYHHGELQSALKLNYRNRKQTWYTSGSFDRSSLETDMNVSTSDTTFYSFNFIRKLAKADIGFKDFRLKLDDIDESDDEINIEGGVYGNRVFIYNEKLSGDTILVEKGGLEFNTTLDRDKVVLAEGSKVILNQVQATLKAQYVYRGDEQVELNVHMPKSKAQALINSLPVGTFEQIRGMRIEGDFDYKLDFFLDLKNKDTIHINSDLNGYNLKIVKYGKGELNKLNTSFTYYPYNSRRPIIVGPQNPNFTPLESISPYLRSAVLTSEDPSFFSHRGFVELAFEQSFLENLEAGAFRRGGSTISMQLVKNVFLSHKKTIDRKLEETFIVWLIENLHLSSKARMFEVYLNIIEWGPNVYGIGEASRFYFNKPPANLSLNESIYLALIIPRPLAWSWRFDEHGHLKEYMQERITFINNLMARRGLVDAEPRDSGWADVYVSGNARNYLKIVPDSTQVEKPDEAEEEKDFFWNKVFDLFKRKKKIPKVTP